MSNHAFDTILREKEARAPFSYPYSTFQRHVAEGIFTKPVKLGARSSGWPQSEVMAIHAARIAGQTDDEIRALVVRLHEARKAAPAATTATVATTAAA